MLHKRIPFFRGNDINCILPELYMRKKEETEKICFFGFCTRSRDILHFLYCCSEMARLDFK
jgi:hypothetical protein